MQIQTIERYLILYDRFADIRLAGSPMEVTMEELSDALFCSKRNTRLILQRLEEEGLIDWLPGRGRGHRSRMVFHKDKKECLLALACNRAESGDYKTAFELLGTYGDGTDAKEKFLAWLDGHFGYRQEERGDGSDPCDTLVYPIVQQVVSIDPADVNYSFDSHLLRQLFDRLLQFDERSGKIVAGLAYHWTSSSDAMEWTFFLRKGVLFHDGRELSANDVVYSFERLLGDTKNRWLMRGVSEITALSRLVVRIRLHKPNRILDRFMCTAAASIIPAELAGQQEETFWHRPVGTGPFRLVSSTSHRIRLEAFSGYYQSRPHLDRVDLVVVPEDFRSDAADAPDVIHTNKAGWPSNNGASGEDWQSIEQLCGGCTMLSWNFNRKGAHQSEAFRQAVRMILNPIDLIEELGGDRVFPAFGFRREASQRHIAQPFSTENVRAALRHAGCDGSPMRIAVHEKYETDARWIADRLQQWGIRAEVIISGTCLDRVVEADCTMFGIVLAEDEVCEIEAYEHGSCVMQSYMDADRLGWISERIDDALAAESEELRRGVLQQIEGRLRDEASVLFLTHRKHNTYLHPSVRGVSKLNSLGWVDFKDVWLEQLRLQ
ncbi:SgrR family transcriptional regulator [Paenibacillus harenae]|uniref:MarR-like DNA-binding transcriptional regulator SgrR of sgrS sRNA n=1 Tax=Paenibacillus harenae TaxID=306543 RepID=A0ABT9U1D1_PAEHA|nr:SgrR family transcriptional regulator [Paenibacillus harenae]MDQ0113358.1 MarR-like DNA-binding transcriptional regulator SgrR of sgrS sRNA [Paenibacillus harenae]